MSTDNQKNNRLFLVDGSGFIFRAYHALPPLTNPQGTPVGAVLGFTNMLVKLLADYQAPNVAIIFDAARENFRNKIYDQYKANRDATPEDLIPQFPLIRQATEAFELPALEIEGYEADDLIATYARIAKDAGKEVTIVSSDKDLMQLVCEGVTMLDPMKNKMIGPDQVVEKFGVTPDKVVDVQALAGDSVDNVPGVPGIGVKTAALLINEYGDLDNLLANADKIKQNKRRENLIEFADMARLSKRLVQLDINVPVTMGIDQMVAHKPNGEKLSAFLQTHGFRSVVSRLSKDYSLPTVAQQAPVPSDNDGDQDAPSRYNPLANAPAISDNIYTLIQDEDTLQQWMDEAQQAGILAIDTETTSLTPMKAELVGISIASTMGRAAYIPLNHKQQCEDLLAAPQGDIIQLPLERALEIMRSVLTDPSVIKIGQNMKYDWQMVARHGVEMTPLDDTMLMSYVVDGTSHPHGMDSLSEEFLGHEPLHFTDVCGKGKKQITFDYVPLDTALDYAAEDADITLRLWHLFKPRISNEKMSYIYEEIERPLIEVIARMEMEGAKIERLRLKDLGETFTKKLTVLEKDIHALAGQIFNIASPKQMGAILFDEMGLKGGKKTKTGDWSTNASTLENLAIEGNEIVVKILEWRGLAKLRSTYTNALQQQIHLETGRVHTSFSMAATTTGRLSSSDPNLQNIPIRTEDGRQIRTAFVAEAGWKILSVDYSQVELRLIAQMANIKALKQAFIDGQDVHATTAASVFGVPLEEVTSDLRRSAKAINFGIIYGISAYGLAKQLGISNGEAKQYIDAYFQKFPELKDFMESAKEEARKNGYVRTMYGRKCTVAGINEKGPRKAFAERQAINAPVQGSAADIMKLAMIAVPKAIKQAGLKARMMIQVHDELVFEVPESELDATRELVCKTMQSVAEDRCSVPLIAEGGAGENWAQAH